MQPNDNILLKNIDKTDYNSFRIKSSEYEDSNDNSPEKNNYRKNKNINLDKLLADLKWFNYNINKEKETNKTLFKNLTNKYKNLNNTIDNFNLSDTKTNRAIELKKPAR